MLSHIENFLILLVTLAVGATYVAAYYEIDPAEKTSPNLLTRLKSPKKQIGVFITSLALSLPLTSSFIDSDIDFEELLIVGVIVFAIAVVTVTSFLRQEGYAAKYIPVALHILFSYIFALVILIALAIFKYI